MRVGVVIPVGPGHRPVSFKAAASVLEWRGAHELSPFRVNDARGTRGRSKARNIGVKQAAKWGAEWIMLLDADDEITGEAPIAAMHPDSPFAAIYTPAHVLHRDRRGALTVHTASPEPTWDWIVRKGPTHSVMMGNLYRTEALLDHPFREDLDHGEDWEHHLSFMAAHPWTLSAKPMVIADTTTPSARGPRGGAVDWGKASDPFFKFWRKRGRVPLTKEERAGRYWE